MDIEGTNEQINSPPSPPASPEIGKEDTLRMSVDGDEKKYPGGVVPHAGDEGVTKPDADDCISLKVAHYRRSNESICPRRSTRKNHPP
jgi:hypothetical protein